MKSITPKRSPRTMAIKASALLIATWVALGGDVAQADAQGGTIISESAKLIAFDGAFGDLFGASVAMSGDTAIVGVLSDDDNGFDSGSAYVFVRGASGAWTLQQKLLPSDGAPGDYFAIVAIQGDTAFVGAPDDDDNGTESGSVYLFTRDANGVWTQQAKLLASDGTTNDNFGNTLALNGDTLLIGATGDSVNGLNSGSAYVFVRNANGVWTQQAKLLASDAVFFGSFGSAVSLIGDTALIGAQGDNPTGTNADINTGAAYVFVRNPSTGQWTQQAKLVGSDTVGGDWLGIAAALTGDTAVVGAWFHRDNGTNSGVAYVFARNPSTGVWTQQTKLLASDGLAFDWFGRSLAIDPTASTILVGAPGDDDAFPAGQSGAGSEYVFARDATGVWTQQARLVPTDVGTGDQFGLTVALEGATVVVGSRFNFANFSESGAAYVFDLPSQGSPADLNGDGVVNGADLATLLTQWGTNGPADLNNDGVVDGADLATLLTNWG